MAWIDSDANSGNKCSAMKPYSYLFHTLLCAMQLFKFQTTLTYLDNIALFQSYISQVSIMLMLWIRNEVLVRCNNKSCLIKLFSSSFKYFWRDLTIIFKKLNITWCNSQKPAHFPSTQMAVKVSCYPCSKNSKKIEVVWIRFVFCPLFL